MSIIDKQAGNNDISAEKCSRKGLIKTKLFLFIYLLFTIVLGIVGLFFSLEYGHVIGIALGLALLLVTIFWGEKIILIFLRARYVGENEDLINQVRNFCLHLKVDEVKIYWSGLFVNNVYFTSSFFGTPAIIIGKNVYKSFQRNELNALIYASLLKIKKKEAAEMTMSSVSLFFWMLPIHLLYLKFKSPQVRKIMTTLYFPLTYLRRAVYFKEKDVLHFDQEVVNFKGLSKDYSSAIFKLSMLPKVLDHELSSFLVEEMVLVDNQEQDSIKASLFQSTNINLRLKTLGTKT